MSTQESTLSLEHKGIEMIGELHSKRMHSTLVWLKGSLSFSLNDIVFSVLNSEVDNWYKLILLFIRLTELATAQSLGLKKLQHKY